MASPYQRRRLDAELQHARRHLLGLEHICHHAIYIIVSVRRERTPYCRREDEPPILATHIPLRWTDPYRLRCLEWREYGKHPQTFRHKDWQYRMPLPEHKPHDIHIHPAKLPATFLPWTAPTAEPTDWRTEPSTHYHEHLRRKHGARRYNRARKLARLTCLSIQYWLEIADAEKFAAGHPVTVRSRCQKSPPSS